MSMQTLHSYPDGSQEMREALRDKNLQDFMNYELFTFNWWLLLLISVLIVFIVYKRFDRSRTMELLTFGLIVGIISAFLDVTGSSLVLWLYPYKLIPVVPPMIPLDLILIPSFYMMVYQHTTRWITCFGGTVLVSAFFSFLLEPLLVWLGIYKLIHWEFYYSFPIYTAIALLVRLLVRRLLQVQARHNQ